MQHGKSIAVPHQIAYVQGEADGRLNLPKRQAYPNDREAQSWYDRGYSDGKEQAKTTPVQAGKETK